MPKTESTQHIECPWCGRKVHTNASGRIRSHIAITDRCIGSGATTTEAERIARREVASPSEFDRVVLAGGIDALSITQRQYARKLLGSLAEQVAILDKLAGVSHEFDTLGGGRRASRLVELKLYELAQGF